MRHLYDETDPGYMTINAAASDDRTYQLNEDADADDRADLRTEVDVA